MSTISTGHAKKLILNYVLNKIGKIITNEETRAVWFPADEIRKVLDTPVEGKMPNGIRFYFAAYEEFDNANPTPTRPPAHCQEGNMITLVMIPTTHEINDEGQIVMHPYRLTEKLPVDLVIDSNERPVYDVTFLKAANDGQLCPPPRTII